MVSGYPRVSVGFPCAACLSLAVCTRRARVSVGFPRRARAALDSQFFFALVARSCFRNMSEILDELLFLRSRISTLAEFEDEVHRGFSQLLGGTFATALSVSHWSVGANNAVRVTGTFSGCVSTGPCSLSPTPQPKKAPRHGERMCFQRWSERGDQLRGSVSACASHVDGTHQVGKQMQPLQCSCAALALEASELGGAQMQ